LAILATVKGNFGESAIVVRNSSLYLREKALKRTGKLAKLAILAMGAAAANFANHFNLLAANSTNDFITLVWCQ
jgi:hypothetical protein